MWAFDILLMDIYLPDGNGMNCARTLRENGYEGIIIFQSSSAEHAVEAYQVDAKQYLLKPISPERFFAAMDRAAEELPKCRKKRGTQETAEPGVQPAGDSVPDQAHTYIRTFVSVFDRHFTDKMEQPQKRIGGLWEVYEMDEQRAWLKARKKIYCRGRRSRTLGRERT